MTKILGKADLLSGENLRRELVEVPDFGASIWMRQMSAVEVIAFKKYINDMQAKGVKETTLEQDVEIMAFIISLSACDENGKLLFTPEEAKGLTRNNINVLTYLGSKALEISKIQIGTNEFIGEATNTLPNAPKMSLSENSPKNSRKRARKS
jgi:hypothetical protein